MSAFGDRRILSTDPTPTLLEGLGNPFVFILGYLITAIVATVFVSLASGSGSTRAAVLIPRGVSDYAPAWIVMLGRITVAMVLVAAVAQLPVETVSAYSVLGLIGNSVIACALFAIYHLVAPLVASKRQSANDVILAALDDASRADKVSQLARIFASGALLMLSSQLFDLGRVLFEHQQLTSNPDPWSVSSNIFRVLAVCSLGASFGVWRSNRSEDSNPVRRLLGRSAS